MGLGALPPVGSRGKAPAWLGGQGAKPPEAERMVEFCNENSTHILCFHYIMINVKDIKAFPSLHIRDAFQVG